MHQMQNTTIDRLSKRHANQTYPFWSGGFKVFALIIFSSNLVVINAAENSSNSPGKAIATEVAVASPTQADNVLMKAYQTTAGFKTFKADILNANSASDKAKSKTVIYQRNNPDGVKEARMESSFEMGDLKNSSVVIINREGQWMLTPTLAIKMEFQENLLTTAQGLMSTVKKAELSPATRTLTETSINNKAYWIVKETISDEVQKRVRQQLENPQIKEMLKDAPSVPMPVITLYRIGKDDSIIYSTQQFDAKGNKISDITYENVEVNIDLPANTFMVPADLKRKIAKTVNDYVEMISK